MAKQGATPASGTDAPDPVIVTRGDATAAVAGAEAGAAIPPIPVEVPGPGAGALQVALPSHGFETVPLDQEGRDPTARAPQFRDTALGVDLTVTGLHPSPALAGISPISAAFAASGATGSVLATARGLADATLVEGERLVTAATNVMRNGTMRRAGDRFPVDYVAFAELVQIGAVVAADWRDLERMV